jgi:UDP-glucuronate 4-epimerase
MKVLVTGVAGFIGMHVAQRLLLRGCDVVGIDNINDYYNVRLKNARLAQIQPADIFKFMRMDVSDVAAMASLFKAHRFTHVIHLAAQAGVRYPLKILMLMRSLIWWVS